MDDHAAISAPVACPVLCKDHMRVATKRAHLLDDVTYVDLAEIFRALGDATRAKSSSACCARSSVRVVLGDLIGISESAVSQHLRLLQALRLVKSRQSDKQFFHSLDDAHIAILLQVGLSHVRHGDADHPAMEGLLAHVPRAGGERS